MTTIQLRIAERHEVRHGIVYVSTTLHEVTGRGVHSRHYNHSVTVWDNTNRLNTDPDQYRAHGKAGPGTYVDPSGKGTDSAMTALLLAKPTAISAHAHLVTPMGGLLTIGEQVTLVFPSGARQDFVVTARSLSDPELVPVEVEPVSVVSKVRRAVEAILSGQWKLSRRPSDLGSGWEGINQGQWPRARFHAKIDLP